MAEDKVTGPTQVGGGYGLDDLVKLLEESRQAPANAPANWRPYQNVLFNVGNTEKELTFTVKFPHKSPSEQMRDQAAEAAQPQPVQQPPPQSQPVPVPKEEVAKMMATYKTSSVEVRLPQGLLKEAQTAQSQEKTGETEVPSVMVYKTAGTEVVLPNELAKKAVEVRIPDSLSAEAKKKGKPVNPWAVCNSNEATSKKNNPEKFERCVLDIKKEHPVKKDDKKEKKSATEGRVPVTAACKEAVEALKKNFPDDFLKKMGIDGI